MIINIDCGYIYILKNESLKDGIFKIGRTVNLDKRISQLSSHTSIPTPFVEVASFYVSNHTDIERFIHKSLKEFRVNDKREFFCANTAEDVILKVKEIIYKYYIKNNLLDDIYILKDNPDISEHLLYKSCRDIVHSFHYHNETPLGNVVEFQFCSIKDFYVDNAAYTLESTLDMLSLDYFLSLDDIWVKGDSVYIKVQRNEMDEDHYESLINDNTLQIKHSGKKCELQFFIDYELEKVIEYFDSEEYKLNRERWNEFHSKLERAKCIKERKEAGRYYPDYDIDDEGNILCTYSDDMALLDEMFFSNPIP